MAISTTIPDDVKKLAEETAHYLDEANKFVIENDNQYEQAGLDLKTIKDKSRELDTKRKLITSPMDEAKKAVMNFFLEPLGFLKNAENVLKKSMLVYQDDKAKKARVEEERLRRIQCEEQERLVKEAEEADKSGDVETANAIIEQAASLPEVIVDKIAPKVHGVRTTIRWSAEVLDKLELIKAVAAGTVPIIALDVNTKFINQQAVSLKDAFNIAGCMATGKKGIAA